MNTCLHADSPSFHSPLHTFPGDQAIDAATYRRSTFSGYVSSVSTVYGAARACGLPVDSETFERWKRGAAAAGLLDDFLDESPREHDASRMYVRGLEQFIADPNSMGPAPAWADPRLEPALKLLHNSVEALPEARKSQLLTSARRIGALAIEKARCRDAASYIGLLQEEGHHTGRLISGSVSETMRVRHEDGFRVFERWCSGAPRCWTAPGTCGLMPGTA